MDSEMTLDYMKTFEDDKMIYEEGRENGIEQGISNGYVIRRKVCAGL
jgi:hypothetical protein